MRDYSHDKIKSRFFFRFLDIFAVDIILLMSRLCMQNFTIIGQVVLALHVVTDRLSQGFILYIDIYICRYIEVNFAGTVAMA